MRYEHKGAPLASREKFAKRVWRNILIAGAFVSISLLLGMLGYHFIGELAWVDSFLNASMILTGMGPVDKMNTDSGKIFAGVYSLFSGIAFLTTIGIALAPILHRAMHKFHLGEDD